MDRFVGRDNCSHMNTDSPLSTRIIGDIYQQFTGMDNPEGPMGKLVHSTSFLLFFNELVRGIDTS